MVPSFLLEPRFLPGCAAWLAIDKAGRFDRVAGLLHKGRKLAKLNLVAADGEGPADPDDFLRAFIGAAIGLIGRRADDDGAALRDHQHQRTNRAVAEPADLL